MKSSLPSTTYYPRLSPPASTPSVEATEKVLSDWFGAPVILLSSGRTALHVYLQTQGFSRYRHKVTVPDFISRCVHTAISLNAFPVPAGFPSDAQLLYHQFGFPQRLAALPAHTIEDCAHSFFTRVDTGQRRWQGRVAIFSLPKFFPTQGMIGGIVVHDEALAQHIRTYVTEQPAVSPAIRTWMRTQIAKAYNPLATASDVLWVESAYELLFKALLPTTEDLRGFPESEAQIIACGQARQERVSLYRDAFGDNTNPGNFWPPQEELLPFAVPYFGLPVHLEAIVSELRRHAVYAGVYHLDINRNAAQPKYQTALLLPCHHLIPLEQCRRVCDIIHSYEHLQAPARALRR